MKHLRTSEIQPEGVSHNPEIMKRVFLRNGEIPAVTTFGQAILQPGQAVDAHAHDTMYEVYYILEGKAKFVINDEVVEAAAGDCVVVESREVHAQSNPYELPVTWVYFGIATD